MRGMNRGARRKNRIICFKFATRARLTESGSLGGHEIAMIPYDCRSPEPRAGMACTEAMLPA